MHDNFNAGVCIGTKNTIGLRQAVSLNTAMTSGRPRGSSSRSKVPSSIGVRVPRTVHLMALPEEVVVIVPQYRGFYYFIVGDEIVIVDRATLEIVAVLPA